jgi:hypothetical protein
MLRPIRQCRHLFESALMKVVEHSASFFGAGSLCTGCLYNSCRARVGCTNWIEPISTMFDRRDSRALL